MSPEVFQIMLHHPQDRFSLSADQKIKFSTNGTEIENVRKDTDFMTEFCFSDCAGFKLVRFLQKVT